MPSEAFRQARRVARKLSAAGHTAWLAGGCVRDALLGKEPKDYDIATDATPEAVLQVFPKGRTVGAHFGVILVKAGDFDFEVATFRTDGDYLDGRRPETVTFASAEEDAQRRDFTINGMFQEPESLEVIDYVGGQEDLTAGRLRAVGEAARRFAEDRLRLLRAVRFASRLGFEIEPRTWDALAAQADRITEISPERIREELDQILVSPERLRGFDLLVQSGLMAAILPEIIALQGCEQPPQWHPEGDVFVHTRLMLKMLPPQASRELVWAVLLHDIAKPAARTVDADGRIRFNGHDSLGADLAVAILQRLKHSNQVIEDVREMVARHMQFMHVQDMRVAKLKRFMARPTFAEEMELHRVDCTSSNGLTDNYQFLQAKEAEFAREPLIPPPLVTGHDLLARGCAPGPEIGRILEEIQNLQLEGSLETREGALAALDRLLPQPNS
ncbi:MAG: CCA tRNA nucleotidyltransferase [Verrucomicrobiota bacterium]